MSRACRSRALGRSHDRIRGTPEERPRDPVGRSSGLQPPGHDGGQRRRHHDDRRGHLRHRRPPAGHHRRRSVAASPTTCDVDDPATPTSTRPVPDGLSDTPPRRASRPRARPTASSRPATRPWPMTQHRRELRLRLVSPATRASAAASTTGTRVRFDLPAATHPCLAFDFRFLSDEFPEYVNTQFNDAFIAQLDTWSVAADPATQTVTRPGNFAGGAGDMISVDAGGPSAMSDAAGARHDVRRRDPAADGSRTRGGGSVHSLYLTIFDQGDAILDSAVFLDNLRFETIDPRSASRWRRPLRGPHRRLADRRATRRSCRRTSRR